FYGTQLWKMTSPTKTVEPTTPTEPEKPKPSEPEKPNPSEPEKPNITVNPSESDKTETTVTTKTDDKKGTAKTGDSTDVTTSLVATFGSFALLVGFAYVLRKKKVRA
ncbi:LPXTG cell wall anchor domain-containing protein, partial [uncultured Catenibacterium sp.]|uniref:LPXTG cell wall anchor domain-containing protein n=1 Tax=uncultured Catenibacterium sp. TaxID=286142 RepID=UPI0025D82BD2